MNASYRLMWVFCQVVLRGYFRWRVFDAQRAPRSGPFIMVANHASFMDPPLVGATLDFSIHYLGRESLFRHPLGAAILRSWSVVPVDRDGGGAKGLKLILERLLAGGGIILFPEGTRSPDGRLQPARAGVGLTVIKSTCPVIPMRLFGTYEAWGRHLKFPRPHRVQVKFGRPMDFAELRAEAQSCPKARLRAIYQEVADELMAVIARLEPGADVDRFPAS